MQRLILSGIFMIIAYAVLNFFDIDRLYIGYLLATSAYFWPQIHTFMLKQLTK